jgi:hypothetical protein
VTLLVTVLRFLPRSWSTLLKASVSFLNASSRYLSHSD